MSRGAGVSAHGMFRHLVRDLIGPGLRGLGFRGGQASGFWYARGEYRADVDARESRYTPEPGAGWARTFPPRPNAWDRLISPPRLDGLARVLAPSGGASDTWFTALDDPDEAARGSALDRIGSDAADDARTLPVLLNRLASDPSDRVRWQAARALAPMAGAAQVRDALAAAAAQDEDLQVRWAARYALRLAAAPV